MADSRIGTATEEDLQLIRDAILDHERQIGNLRFWVDLYKDALEKKIPILVKDTDEPIRGL